jgi:hypothetical protein
MVFHTKPASLLLASFLLAPTALAAPMPDVDFYLHRDGTMDSRPPTAGDDATFEFGPAFPGTTVDARFQSTTPVASGFVGTGLLRATIRSTVVINAEFSATLDVGGQPVAESGVQIIALSNGDNPLVLSFSNVSFTPPADASVGLTIRASFAVGQVLPPGIQVTMLYDSATHQSGVRFVAGTPPNSTLNPDATSRPGGTGSLGGIDPIPLPFLFLVALGTVTTVGSAGMLLRRK